jgi:hypothetical protein
MKNKLKPGWRPRWAIIQGKLEKMGWKQHPAIHDPLESNHTRHLIARRYREIAKGAKHEDHN